jgi:6-pyruvoyl-tetrahydropterin synthase
MAIVRNPSQTELQAKDRGAIFIRGLTTIDSAIFDPALGVVGASWYLDLEVHGQLDENGFVHDFSHVKKLARQVMKDSVDHALILPVSSKGVDYSENETGEHWRLHARCKITGRDHVWEYQCPKGATYPIRCVSLQKNVIELEIAKLLKHRLPSSVQDVKVTLREEAAEVTAAFFKYTHGITNHDGLCQRLFHGHRSRMEVLIGDERRPDLEHYVTREIFGSEVHIATPKQFVSGMIEPGMRGRAGEMVELAYTAVKGGRFFARLPADRVFVVENETSIESLAQQIAVMIRAEERTSLAVKVLAYEGIQKGAMAIR